MNLPISLHSSKMMLLIIQLLLTLISVNPAYAQISGCTDTLAVNYNSAATANNGSCAYINTTYTPPVIAAALNDVLPESSGLQMAGNYLWSFNDRGGAAALYRIDTVTSQLLQTVNLLGVVNVDWEDIAFDGTYFYIGDFGNNADGARTDLKIYKFPLSAVPDYITNPVANIAAQQIAVINFYYADQPQPPQPTSNNNTRFDCEAMIVDSGQIHLFTKNWIDLTTTHYIINGVTAGSYIASPLETLVTNYLVTAADKVYDQKIIVLMGYQTNGFGKHFIHLLTDYRSGNYFNGNKRQLDLPPALEMGQAEGICFRNSTYGYISNEKITSFITVNQQLRSFDISAYISNEIVTYVFTGNGNWSSPANWMNSMIPPAITNPGTEIIIDPVSGGDCILNIPYTVSAGSKLKVKSEKKFVINGNLQIQ